MKVLIILGATMLVHVSSESIKSALDLLKHRASMNATTTAMDRSLSGKGSTNPSDPGTPTTALRTSDRYWTGYGTGNFRGNFENSFECDANTIIVAITGYYQGGYGLVNLVPECSNGKSARVTGNNNGRAKDQVLFREGFTATTMFEQDGYGVVNWQLKSKDGATNYGTENFNGAARDIRACNSNDVLVGLKVAYQSGYGIVNFVGACGPSIAATAAAGRWVYLRALSGDQTLRIMHGTTKAGSETTTNSWATSVTTTVSTSLAFGSFGSDVSVETSVANEQSHAYSSEWGANSEEEFTVYFSSSYEGKILWQWQFFVEDNYGNQLNPKTRDYAITNGRYERPRCFPGYATDQVAYQTCFDSLHTLPGH